MTADVDDRQAAEGVDVARFLRQANHDDVVVHRQQGASAAEGAVDVFVLVDVVQDKVVGTVQSVPRTADVGPSEVATFAAAVNPWGNYALVHYVQVNLQGNGSDNPPEVNSASCVRSVKITKFNPGTSFFWGGEQGKVVDPSYMNPKEDVSSSAGPSATAASVIHISLATGAAPATFAEAQYLCGVFSR